MKQSNLPTRAAVLVAGALAATAVAWATVGSASAGETRLGDANCDGFLTSIDALLVLQLHAGLIDEVCGDVDVTGDGEVNSIDALFLLYFNFDPIFPLTPAPTTTPAPTPTPLAPTAGEPATQAKRSDVVP